VLFDVNAHDIPWDVEEVAAVGADVGYDHFVEYQTNDTIHFFTHSVLIEKRSKHCTIKAEKSNGRYHS